MVQLIIQKWFVNRAHSAMSANMKWGLGIFLGALIVRLIYLGEASSAPYFKTLVLDANEYDRLASGIVSGDWLLKTTGFYVHGPLYTYLLALLKACGLEYWGIRFFQGLIGASTASLIFFVTTYIFPRPIPQLAGFMAAFYWPFIFFGGELLATTLFLGLELLLSMVLLRWGNNRPYGIIGVALLTALLILTRANALLLVPLVVWWLWRIASTSNRIRNIVLFALVCVAALVPFMGQNYIAQGSLLPFQGGWSFYMGNNPNADGTPYARQGLIWQRLENLPLKEEMGTPIGLGNFYRTAAWRYIVQNPGAYLHLLYRKFRLFWHEYEIPVSADMRYMEAHVRVADWLLNFGLLVPLALVGLVSSPWSNKKVQLLGGFILIFLISGLLFSVCARYRLPALPFLLVFAAAGLWRLCTVVRVLRLNIVVWGLVLAGSIALVHTGIQRQQVDHLRSPWLLGHLYLQNRQYDKALETYYKGIRQYPGDADIYNSLAVTHEYLGQVDEAIVAYQRAVELAPDFAKAWINLGKLYLKQEALKNAQAAFNKALEHDLRQDTQYEANYTLGQSYMVQKEFSLARYAFIQALSNKKNHHAYYGLSAAAYQLGDTKEQIHSLEQAVGIDSTFAPAYRNLGVLYIQKRDYIAAENALQQAIIYAPSSAIAYRHLAELYRRTGRQKQAQAALQTAQKLHRR